MVSKLTGRTAGLLITVGEARCGAAWGQTAKYRRVRRIFKMGLLLLEHRGYQRIVLVGAAMNVPTARIHNLGRPLLRGGRDLQCLLIAGFVSLRF